MAQLVVSLMASLSRKFASLGAVTALVALIIGETELQAQVDQEHWIESPNYGFNVLFGIQQEFVPSLNRLDTVELSIARLTLSPVFPDGFAAVNIRAQGINGPILAVSEPVYVPPLFRGSLVFPFPESVSLVPGTLYAIEPFSIAEGGQWAFDAASPPVSLGYPAGMFSRLDHADLLFREGIGIIPEPSPLILLSLNLGLIVIVVKRNRANQTLEWMAGERFGFKSNTSGPATTQLCRSAFLALPFVCVRPRISS